MASVWGGEDCWGENAPSEDRWRCVLSSGCSIGDELRTSWERIQNEARISAEWLGEEIPGVLNVAVEGIGDGSVSGDTQGKVVEAIENTRSKVLDKSLKILRPINTLACLCWEGAALFCRTCLLLIVLLKDCICSSLKSDINYYFYF